MGDTDVQARRAITFDMDWAPDWAIAECADLCRRAGVPATFFVTHGCDVLADLRRSGRVELGIHPNFLPGSDQGVDARQVLETCMATVPEARAMRSHSLVQSSPLLASVLRHTPVTVDVSLLLPFHAGLRPTKLFLGEARPLVRLPYVWEDDVAALWPDWDWERGQVPDEGLCILDFHPIHVALNTADLDNYAALRRSLEGRPLASATAAEVARFRNSGAGARSFLERMLADPSGYATISELAA